MTDVSAGKLPFYLLGWYPDYFDSDDYVSPFLQTDGAKVEGSYYSNATMDQWITQEENTTDNTQRANLFGQIQNKLATDVPYIPLWQNGADIEYKSGITGVYLHPVTFKYFPMEWSGVSQLIVRTIGMIVCLDPACAYDYFSIEIINQVFDTLLVYAPNDTTLLPGLATQVPSLANGGISSDGMNYTYHLRQGVKFSDGTPFNATVMKWSIERVIALGDPGGDPPTNHNYDAAQYGTDSSPEESELLQPRHLQQLWNPLDSRHFQDQHLTVQHSYRNEERPLERADRHGIPPTQPTGHNLPSKQVRLVSNRTRIGIEAQ